jgi:hypothetical protein
LSKARAAKVNPGDAVTYARRRYTVHNVYPLVSESHPVPPYFLLTPDGVFPPLVVTYKICQPAD